MACVITSPRDAIRRLLQNFTYKHTVRLRDDAIYSLGASFWILWKRQVHLIILYV